MTDEIQNNNDNIINIIIGTTALNRPMLHSDIFPDWINWIYKEDKTKYKIHWFVNIDMIEKLKSSFDDTVENIKTIVNDRFSVYFLKCENNVGNFLKACQRLAKNIKSFVEDQKLNTQNTKIIWLEDDWKLNPSSIIDLNDLINKYSTDHSHINLTFIRQNYIHALAPSIMSYKLWLNVHYNAWMQQIENTDPEHCVGVYFLNTYKTKYNNIFNITVINKYIEESYLHNSFINDVNSYYTYNNNERMINAKHISINEIKNKFKNEYVFIRITPTVCIDGCDYGRKFMEKYDLFKNKSGDCDKFYI